MPKLVALRQEMIIGKLTREYKIIGKVLQSNFVEEGSIHAFPIHDKVGEVVAEGDRIRISFFTNKEDIVQGRNGISFKGKGTRYERWNEETSGWDKVYEEFPPAAKG